MVFSNRILEERDFQATLKLEKDLQKINQTLERKVQQQAVELSDVNQQLNREKALRQQAETALEQQKQLAEHFWHFVSMLSHEFRSPLNTISLSTSLLKRHHHRWTEEKKLEYLQRLQIAVENISLLMDEVLTIAKAETGKLKFDPILINPMQFCRDILTEMNLNESTQQRVTFISQGDCTVYVDQKLLHSILKNLLSNAVKYSPIGSTIDLVLSYQDQKVIFQIKDRGIGIPKVDQQRLFKPFHRGENVGNIPGNGLGLALVKKLVDLHGGQITVVSELGVGTTFAIALPVAEQQGKG
jgi:signal transduction histidine kinase